MQEDNLRRGPWLEEEDEQLTAIVALKGEKRWDSLAKASGLRRSGKSCRLRWMNYLRPNLKHGRLSAEEERTIIQLHKPWGNKWSKIARKLPGRTDNEIKNYWRSHLRKEAKVQEQGYCDDHFKNSAKQELLVQQKLDTTSDSKSDEEEKEEEDYSLRTNDDPSQAFEFSNYAIASSPYEKRISDCLSSSWSSTEQSKVSHRGDYDNPSLDSCFCYPVWNSQDSDISIWDSSSSLWDTY